MTEITGPLNSLPCGTWRQGNKLLALNGLRGGGDSAFRPRGQFLAAGGSEGRIHVWDVESGNLEETYTEHEDAQMFPHYTPEDGLIAAAVSESNVEVWNIGKNEKLDEFQHRGNSRIARFSESGTQISKSQPPVKSKCG